MSNIRVTALLRRFPDCQEGGVLPQAIEADRHRLDPLGCGELTHLGRSFDRSDIVGDRNLDRYPSLALPPTVDNDFAVREGPADPHLIESTCVRKLAAE